MIKNKIILDKVLEKRIMDYLRKYRTKTFLLKSKDGKTSISITSLSERTPLQNLLNEYGLNLLDIKEKTGISYPVLIDINRGYRLKHGKRIKYIPQKRTMRDIAEAFNIPFVKFLADYKNSFNYEAF